MAGKGSSRRPRQISLEIEELRWQLIDPKTTKEEKEDIKKRLEELRKIND